MISFYKALNNNLIVNIIGSICLKILESKHKCLIYIEDSTHCADLDDRLWTFAGNEFIPHAIVDNKEFIKFIDLVPILLAHSALESDIIEKFENIIFINDFTFSEELESKSKLIYIFDGSNQIKSEHARVTWKEISNNQTLELKSFVQQENLAWK